MFLTPRRKSPRRWLRNILAVVGLVLVFDLWIALRNYKVFEHNLVVSTVSHVHDLPQQVRNQKIYIAAQFWTSADTIIDFWQEELLNLIDTLGVENVYISIVASKGLDNTDEILKNLDVLHLAPRKVARTIIIDPTTHQDAIDVGPVNANGRERDGWIYTGDSNPPGQKELRRIPYLADQRNKGLEPLLRMHREEGVQYDKILFLNDVMFQSRDVLSLMATNQGVFDIACAFDFHITPTFYDTFALRDDQGYPASSQYFPFYRSSTSRHKLLQGHAVPVKSCWNGMVVADTAPYYNTAAKISGIGKQLNAHTQKRANGLQYRGIPDTLAAKHLEGSECCLIHADLIATGQAKKGLFMNPAVRVGYHRSPSKWPTTAYQDVHVGPKGLGWVTVNEYVYGIWQNRFYRWFTFPSIEKRALGKKLAQWKQEGKQLGEVREETGDYCIIDEMHILIWNGWKHV